MAKARGGARPNAGRPKRSVKESSKNTKDVIKALAAAGRMENQMRIFYIPCFHPASIKNYEETILLKNKKTGEKIAELVNNKLSAEYQTAGIWAVKDGAANLREYNKMNCGDAVFFLTKNTAGFHCADSIAYIGALFQDNALGEVFWHDSDYRNFFVIEKLIRFQTPLPLSIHRVKCAAVEGVPENAFHNSYEMFRQWSFLEKDEKNKKTDRKLIEEQDFIATLLAQEAHTTVYQSADGTESDASAPSSIAAPGSAAKPGSKILDLDVSALLERDAGFSSVQAEKNQNPQMKQKRGRSRKNDTETMSNQEKTHLGMCGERYIAALLEKKNPKLLQELGLSPEETLTAEWYNQGYFFCSGQQFWEDQSVGKGHDIKVTSKSRTVFLEVKSSWENSPYYTMTNNEMIKDAQNEDTYYVIKVNCLKFYASTEKRLPIAVIKNPLARSMNDLSKIKMMTLEV